MSLKEFKLSDLFFNNIRVNPRFEIKIYNGDILINNKTDAAAINNIQILPPAGGCETKLDFSCAENSFYIGLF